MDRLAPETYVESTEEGLARTEAFIEHVRERAAPWTTRGLPLVEPAVVPRFVPTCTTRLLRGLGDLATKHVADSASTSHSNPTPNGCKR